jgi:predicted nucleic acid-binding protein
LENADGGVEKVFLEETVAICGITKAELMYGARSEKDWFFSSVFLLIKLFFLKEKFGYYFGSLI